MPDFDNIRHPDFDRMVLRWKMAQAFARGGIHVLKPEYAATPGWVGVRVGPDESSSDSPGLERDNSRYVWTSKTYESFLWKHRRELDEEFVERQERQIHVPLFQSLTNIFSAGILRKPPTYGDTQPAGFWKEFVSDVDMCGTSINAFRRMALHGGLTFGRMHAVTDRPMVDVEARSLGEQLDRGERPYSYLFSPLQLVDWELDSFGQFVWARIAEPLYAPRMPWEPQGASLTQYRVWYRDGWQVYWPKRDDKGNVGYEVEFEDEHSLGRVPIRTLNLSKEGQRYNMAVESPLGDALDADRYCLNGMSELDELERAQAFALLFIPGQPRGGVNIGPFRAIGGEDTTQAPSYIAPPTELANSKLERINAKLWAFRQYEGAGRGLAEFSKEERSGEALNIETEDKRNQMSLWASALQDFENGIYEDTAGWNGDDGSTMPVVKYPDNFDVKSISAQVQEIVSLVGAGVGIVPQPAAVRVAMPVVERMLRDNGADDESITIVRGIMSASANASAIASEESESVLAEGVLGTVGGLTALMSLMEKVASGALASDNAKAVMQDVFGVSDASANRMLGRAETIPAVGAVGETKDGAEHA